MRYFNSGLPATAYRACAINGFNGDWKNDALQLFCSCSCFCTSEERITHSRRHIHLTKSRANDADSLGSIIFVATNSVIYCRTINRLFFIKNEHSTNIVFCVHIRIAQGFRKSQRDLLHHDWVRGQERERPGKLRRRVHIFLIFFSAAPTHGFPTN